MQMITPELQEAHTTKHRNFTLTSQKSQRTEQSIYEDQATDANLLACLSEEEYHIGCYLYAM